MILLFLYGYTDWLECMPFTSSSMRLWLMALTVQCVMCATYQYNFEPSPYQVTAPAAVVQLTQSACHYVRSVSFNTNY